MIKKIVHDPILLAGKSEVATIGDLQVAQDLLDTLIVNKEGCIGMAANMIGVRKRIICFDNKGTYMTMFNPEITKQSEPYNTEEGCLSLFSDTRHCKCYKKILPAGRTRSFKPVSKPSLAGQHKLFSVK